MPGYSSPGAAASSAIFETLAGFQKAKMLQQQHELEVQKLQADQENARIDHNLKQMQMQALAEEKARQAKEADTKDTLGALDQTYVEGDYLDPSDPNVKKAMNLGILRQRGQVQSTAPTIGTLATPPGMEGAGIPVKQGLTPQLGGPAAVRFASPATKLAQQKQTQSQAQVQAFINSLDPNDPRTPGLKMWAQAQAMSPEAAPPADLLKPAEGPTQEWLVNPRTGKLENIGSFPKGSHVNIVPAPASVNVNNGPQPKEFYDQATGEMKSLQFVNGAWKEVPLPAGLNLGTTNPVTSTMRTRMDAAQRVGSHIEPIRELIKQVDAAGQLGPVLGRYGEFMAGKYGSTGNAHTDEILNNLRTQLTLMKSGVSMVHSGARGAGVQLMQSYDKLLNSGKMSPAELNGALNGMGEWMKTYAKSPKDFMAGIQEIPPGEASKAKVDWKTIADAVRKGG